MLSLAPRFAITRSLCLRHVQTTTIQLRSLPLIATRALSVTALKLDNRPSPPSSIEQLASSNSAFSPTSPDSYIKKIVHEELTKTVEFDKAEAARRTHIHEENAMFVKNFWGLVGGVIVALVLIKLMTVVEKSMGMAEEMKAKVQEEVYRKVKRHVDDHVANLRVHNNRARAFAGILNVVRWMLRWVVDMAYTATTAAMTLAFIVGCSKATKGIIHQLEISKALRKAVIIK